MLVILRQVASKSQNAESAELEDMMIQFGEGVDLDILKPNKEAEAGSKGGDTASLLQGVGYFFKVRGSPFIYQYARPFYSKFLKSPDVFRPHVPLAGVKLEAIERINLTFRPPKVAVRQLQLVGSGGHFVIAEPKDETREPDKAKLQKWLTRLMDFRVLTYLPFETNEMQSLGLLEPAMELQVKVMDAAGPLNLLFGSEVKEGGKPAERRTKAAGNAADLPPRHVLVTFPGGEKAFAVVNGEVAEEFISSAEELS